MASPEPISACTEIHQRRRDGGDRRRRAGRMPARAWLRAHLGRERRAGRDRRGADDRPATDALLTAEEIKFIFDRV